MAFNDNRRMADSHLSFLRTLRNLRWLAIACQLLVLLVAVRGLGLALSVLPMLLAVGMLAAFNGYASWRLAHKGGSGSAWETFLHILVDVAVLAWLIGCSGGIANPFTSLFLLPIAFAALALPPRWLYATTFACCLGYAVSALFGRALPHAHNLPGDGFDLHLWGMVVNFLISVAVLVYFLAQLATAQRRREQELAHLRERFARNEGIVALATHAASVAHELNTPLATLTLMLDDLVETPEHYDAAALHEEHSQMRGLVDVCRDRVRELASPASAEAGAVTQVGLEQEIERWQRMRPGIALDRDGILAADFRVDAAVGHLLLALLNNAADASQSANRAQVELRLRAVDGELNGVIRDYGAGFDVGRVLLPGTLFDSSKPDGLGVGLALSHATVERLGGELSMHSVTGDGASVRFRLPITKGDT